MKKLLLILIISYLIIRKLYVASPSDADIVIAPCGIKGCYTLGICHYIKNNFDIKNKKIVGFSSGSFNTLFMNLDHEKNIEFIRTLLRIKLRRDIKEFLLDIINNIKQKFKDHDFNLKNTNIAVTHSDGLNIYNNFLNLKDALNCCTGSSFVPFVTYKDLLYFYNYKLCLDGGLLFQPYIKNTKKLVITHYMFKRYKKPRTFLVGLVTDKTNVYQMYINGYNDARNNHDYFSKFLKPL